MENESKLQIKTLEAERSEGRTAISFIMPVYNGEKYLEKAAESVLQIGRSDLELLIMDDGSVDRTAEICDMLASKDRRIRVFHGQNRGQGAARNSGIEKAEGQYIAFIDADDQVIAENMTKMADMVSGEAYDVLCGNYIVRSGSKSTLSVQKVPSGEVTRSTSMRSIYQRIKNEGVFGYCWNKLYRRSFIQENNIRFSEKKGAFMEDAQFNLLLFSAAPKYYYFKEPVYFYYIREGSTSHTQDAELGRKVVEMLRDYESGLTERGLLEENRDLLVPLAFRQYCWCLYNQAVMTSGNREALEKACRQFTDASSFRTVLKPGGVRYLKTVISPVQRVFYIYCYHYLKKDKVKKMAAFYSRLYVLMQCYDRYFRRG